jgi:hypothetical protein
MSKTNVSRKHTSRKKRPSQAATPEEAPSTNPAGPGHIEDARWRVAEATKGILKLHNAVECLTVPEAGRKRTPAVMEWVDAARLDALRALWALHIEEAAELVELPALLATMLEKSAKVPA